MAHSRDSAEPWPVCRCRALMKVKETPARSRRGHCCLTIETEKNRRTLINKIRRFAPLAGVSLPLAFVAGVASAQEKVVLVSVISRMFGRMLRLDRTLSLCETTKREPSPPSNDKRRPIFCFSNRRFFGRGFDPPRGVRASWGTNFGQRPRV